MKKEKRKFQLTIVVLPLILFTANHSYAQHKENISDTVIRMKEAVIVSNRLQQFAPGSKIRSIDSVTMKNYSANSLSDIISSETQVHINAYGVGGQSTISMRGTGESHTAVLWNGFNLQDILNGGVDLSLIPAIFLDDVKLQYGGCGALFGSGAIGGVFHLNNTLAFNQGINAAVAVSAGSYSNYFEGAGFRISREKYATAVRFFNHSAKNDFEFINTNLPGHPKQKQKNSDSQQKGILIDNYFKINTEQKVSIHLWFQDNEHNIPPDMSVLESKSNEKNNFTKCSAEWSRGGKKSDIFLRTAYFNNYKYYTNPLYDMKSKYQSMSSITEVENNYKISSRFKLNSGINYTLEKGNSDNIDGNHSRDRIAVFSSLKYNDLNYKWETVLSVREEQIKDNFSPLTYSLGFEGKPVKGLDLKGNINKSYRIPSFNDLYWEELSTFWNSIGNPDLKSEEGLNEEFGMNYKTSLKKISFDIGVTVFNSNVTNWILWQPIDSITWMPFNVNTVYSRGLEGNADITYRWEKVLFKLSGIYTLVKTTNETTLADVSVLHKQLIYVPKQKAAINLFLKYKGYELTYSQNYVGKRFCDAENKNFVEAYEYGSLILSKVFLLKKYSFSADFHINNIWDKTYQVMAFYPMPLRNFQAGIKISFNQMNKK